MKQKKDTTFQMLVFSISLLFGSNSCGQFVPTQINGTTYTVKGYGLLGTGNGVTDKANLYRAKVEKSGSYGLIGYFSSITNSGQSSAGIGLVSDKLQTLRGKRKIIVAMFEGGNIVVKCRQTDYGVMNTLASVAQPVGAWLKCQVVGTGVAFYYSTSPKTSNNPTWVLIGNYTNILPYWTNIMQTYCVSSSINAYQTAIIENVSEYNGGGGGGAYALNGITVAQSPNNATRFQITPAETNKPAGNVTYSLVIRDQNNNIVYSDPNISTDTGNYPTIDFTPAYSGFSPHVTTAGAYTVSVSANGVTQTQNVTFTNANLGIQSNNSVTGSSTTVQYNNSSTWVSPSPNTTPKIKYIGTINGQCDWNGHRTIDLTLTPTSDPEIHKIEVTKSSPNATGYSVVFVDGNLIDASGFFVRTGEIHQVTWLYGANDYNSDVFNSSTNSAVLIFNVTKNQ